MNVSIHSRQWWDRIRPAVLRRDNWRCGYCGIQLVSGVNATVDHIVRREHGGDSRWSNLKACCWDCQDETKRAERMLHRGFLKTADVVQTQSPTYTHMKRGRSGPLLRRGSPPKPRKRGQSR